MQERADRCRRHHRGRQPGVHRHHRGLGEAEEIAEIDDRQQRRRGIDPRQQPTRHEIERPRHVVGQRQRGEKHAFRRAHQIDEVLAAARPSLVVLVVVDERIGDEAEHLVEDHQREQIGGEGAPDGRREAGGEAGEEPGLRVLVQVPHVADGIDRRHDPQQRRDGGKHHAERIGPESEVDPRQNLEQAQIDRPARQHRGRHRGDNCEHGERRQRRDDIAEFLAVVQKENCKCRQTCDRDGKQRPDRYHRVQAAILSSWSRRRP